MKNKLTLKQHSTIIEILSQRFSEIAARHKGVSWDVVQKRLKNNPEKLWAIEQMEQTGGEPDVIGTDKKTGEIIFCDCSHESPAGRRSLCYDGLALKERKENKPKGSAMDMAAKMGIELLNEDDYGSCKLLANSISKHPRGCKRPQISANSAEPYSATAGMIRYLYTTTAHNHTTPQGDLGGR